MRSAFWEGFRKGYIRAHIVAALAALPFMGACATYAPVAPPAEPPPVVAPPEAPPPVLPPPTIPPDAPPVGSLPAIGALKADVVAAWGPGSDLPENPGEDDSVAYVRSIDGRDAEVHVIYRGGRVLRVVATYLVTPGGG